MRALTVAAAVLLVAICAQADWRVPECLPGSYMDSSSPHYKYCRPCPPGLYSNSVGAPRCKACDLNFAMARKEGMSRCDWCSDGATTENSRTCLTNIRLLCNPSDPGSEVCRKTTDRQFNTFATIPAGSTVRYRLERPAKLASITFLRKNDCCSDDVEDLKITLSDNSWCTISRENTKRWSTKKYVRMNHCTSRDYIEYFEVSTWKRSGSVTFREIQFDSL
ncbi:hypothetical protein BOX15_Mlig016455g3 [Macrostomum lignano]|uniref:Ephrin_rec_like domain-containing protein n=1 Tax=Macrostomum lignano TaxID=282301 RepID=A0A267G842_9PLAT|nr:hypothetical protein BOX15_Mlig016455g3 [Macrostomum lignano]